MTVMEAIEARRSIRKYQPVPIEPEKLSRVLEAGRLAPSARNAQIWQFVLVRDAGLRQKLVAACCDQGMVGEAPAVLVVCATQTSTMACGQERSSIDCAIALSFMMLEAAEQGLGTCWLGAFHADQVSQVLGLPQHYIPVAVSDRKSVV